MKLLSRIFGAPSTFQMRVAALLPAMQALHPREMYKLLDAYYLNNGLYDYLQQALYEEGVWKEALKPLRNPAKRVVEFYPAHLWPGSLPDALPIKTDNRRIIEPIQQIWRWSNWGANKQLAARQLAKYGDLFIKVSQTESRDQVYFQLIEPEYVSEFDADHRDYLTYIRVDIPQLVREGGETKSYTWTEIWDKSRMTFRAWRHTKGPGADEEQLGRPRLERVLAPAPGGEDSDQYVGVDFVPFVHGKFMDIGEDRGAGAFTLALDKIDEANRKATRLSQMIFRYNKALWAIRANAMDPTGRPMPAPRIGGATGDPGSGDTLELGDDRLLRLPGTSELHSLVPNIDYQAHLEALRADLQELEEDLPELIYYRLKDKTGDPSGRALQLLLAPAVDRALEARGNAETALIRANQMALTMGMNAGLFGDIGDYEAGDYEHSFIPREIMPLPELEQAEESKIYVEMGVPLKTALRRQGWTEADLQLLEKDQEEQRGREQETLAAAVLRAQRAMDSGQASNGLEQGNPAAEDAEAE